MCSRLTLGRLCCGLVPVAALLLGGCANDVTDTLVERPLGALSELGVNLQFRMSDDPLLLGYTRLLGDEAKAKVHRTNVPYRFRLVDNDSPNAFAIPWGGIYVTRGLLRFAESEDEVAFVVGHEVGHVERRHGSLDFQRSLLINVALILATNRNTESWLDYAYMGNHFLDLHWSRKHETMADHEGVRFACMTGHDPGRGIDFFQRLDERYGATPRFWGYFETHPINRDRISYVRSQPQLSTSDPAAMVLIAEGYRKRGLYRSAEARYRQALAADPQYGDAHLGLARAAAWRGDVREAREQYDQALQYGVAPQLVNAEVSTLPEQPPVPAEVILASAADVQDATRALDDLGPRVIALRDSAKAGYEKPLDADSALVSGNDVAGAQLDGLYRVRGKLDRDVQDSLLSGQKVRAAALRAATSVGGVQEEAYLSAELLEGNRRRILERLGAQPTVGVLAVARELLQDSDRATRELSDSGGRLAELVPAMRDRIRQDHRVIDDFRQGVRPAGPFRPLFPPSTAAALESAEHDTDALLRRIDRARAGIAGSRARGLISSLDITMVDRRAPERQAAERIVERFMQAPEGAVEQALAGGLSFGEAAYVLGVAKAANDLLPELLQLAAAAGRRDCVEQLSTRAPGTTGSVAILLKLVDCTLKDELDPGGRQLP